jgi:hypothetical protein
METKSKAPSVIHTADKSPTVIELFAGDVACDGATGDQRADGDAVAYAVAYAVYLADGERLAENERLADHIGDELMGDQDTEALVVLDKDCDGDGMAEGVTVIVRITVGVVRAVEE